MLDVTFRLGKGRMRYRIHSEKSNGNIPTARYWPKAPALLLLSSIMVLFWIIPINPGFNVPPGYLAEQTSQPKVLSPQQARHLRQTHGAELQQHKAAISAPYLHQIRRHLDPEKTDSLAQAEKLLQTLG
jgi:hypothetical protein